MTMTTPSPSTYATHTLRFLFPEIKDFPKQFQNKLAELIKKDLEELHCCVIWKRNDDFMKLLANFPELPEIGKKEVIISQTSARGSLNLHTRVFKTLWEF